MRLEATITSNPLVYSLQDGVITNIYTPYSLYNSDLGTGIVISTLSNIKIDIRNFTFNSITSVHSGAGIYIEPSTTNVNLTIVECKFNNVVA